MKAKYIGNVKDGKLKIINIKVFHEHLNSLNGDVILTLEKRKKQRSNPQNSYWHGVVVPIVKKGLKDAGFNIYQNEDVHELLKLKFLKDTLTNESGEYIERIKSTTELSTTEFAELIQDVQQWSMEFLNTYIPDPNENLELL